MNNPRTRLFEDINIMKKINESNKKELEGGANLIYDDSLLNKITNAELENLINILNGFITNTKSNVSDIQVAHDGNILTIRTQTTIGGNTAEVIIDGYSDSVRIILSDNTLELNDTTIQNLIMVNQFYNATSDDIKALSR